MQRSESLDSFFVRLSHRIACERNLAQLPGVRQTARTAAADRARHLAQDLDYLKAVHGRDPVMVGEDHGI